VPLVKKTVEHLTGIPIDYWVKVDMNGFQAIVDAVGGVDVVIDRDLDYEDPTDTPPLIIHLKKGAQRLNGEDALRFVRFRHDDQSDWGRAQRQQQFLQALVKAAKRPANIPRIPLLLKLGLENVETNLSPSQVAKMAGIAQQKMNGQSISNLTLQGEDLWTSDGYYLALDFEGMRATIRKLAGLPDDQGARARDATDAVAYKEALPKGSVGPLGLPEQPVATDQHDPTDPKAQPGTPAPKPGADLPPQPGTPPTVPGNLPPPASEPGPGSGETPLPPGMEPPPGNESPPAPGPGVPPPTTTGGNAG
jgi:hypothetical protein